MDAFGRGKSDSTTASRPDEAYFAGVFDCYVEMCDAIEQVPEDQRSKQQAAFDRSHYAAITTMVDDVLHRRQQLLNDPNLTRHQMSTLRYDNANWVEAHNDLLWKAYAALGMLEYLGPYCTRDNFSGMIYTGSRLPEWDQQTPHPLRRYYLGSQYCGMARASFDKTALPAPKDQRIRNCTPWLIQDAGGNWSLDKWRALLGSANINFARGTRVDDAGLTCFQQTAETAARFNGLTLIAKLCKS